MSRRNRRVVPPPRPTVRSKEKDMYAFPKLLNELRKTDLSKTDVHLLLDYLYERYEGEYRYYNRLLKDKNKMIV